MRLCRVTSDFKGALGNGGTWTFLMTHVPRRLRAEREAFKVRFPLIRQWTWREKRFHSSFPTMPLPAPKGLNLEAEMY